MMIVREQDISIDIYPYSIWIDGIRQSDISIDSYDGS